MNYVLLGLFVLIVTTPIAHLFAYLSGHAPEPSWSQQLFKKTEIKTRRSNEKMFKNGPNQLRK